jgi:predicted GIY-YIG superfamily endonuclease
MVTYLIHFEKNLGHARHYIGATKDLKKRMMCHENNRGASIMKAVNKKNIKWVIAKIWNKGFDFEKSLKKQKNIKRICPICNPKYNGVYK